MSQNNINISVPESVGNILLKLYDDFFHPFASASGELLALVPETLAALSSPLKKFNAKRKYNLECTQKLLSEKLESATPEQIVSPEPYVAIPALENISYAMNSTELRNLYANLLAKSIYEPTKDYVHPSFAEIIKQLSPADADMFKIIYESNDAAPLIDLRAIKEQGGSLGFTSTIDCIPKITKWENYSYSTQICSLNNLHRLGLINTETILQSYTDDNLYNPVRNSNSYLSAKNQLTEKYPECKIDEDCSFIETLPFGELFYKVCVSDSIHQTFDQI